VQVTEVRIKLMEGSEDRLRAFCSITLDHCFVVRDLKVIDGTSGPFVAMPSRKLSGHCYRCNYKNHLRAVFCNQCGTKLKAAVAADSPQKLYADVAHPVNSECREMISSAVLAEFENELARAAEPGYRSRYDDDFDAIAESNDELFRNPAGSSRGPRPRPEPDADRPGPTLRVDAPHDAPHGGPDRRVDEVSDDAGESTQGNFGGTNSGGSAPSNNHSGGGHSGGAPSAQSESPIGNHPAQRAVQADSRDTFDGRLPGSGRIDSGHSEKRTRPADERLNQPETGFGSGIFD
jgi:stage V sporulation protein G